MVITKIEELSGLKYRQPIQVKCPVCGKVFNTRANRKDLLCKGCKCLQTKTANGTLKHSEETKSKISAAQKGHITVITEEQKEKRKQTNKERYGGEPLANKEIREKAKKTCLEKYGAENFMSSEEGKKALAKKTEESNKKRMETVLAKYGVKCATLIDGCKKRYTYDGVAFDSAWELALWIYCQDHKIAIERCSKTFEYEYADIIHQYTPDFVMNSELIEIKGPQFFENGKMINPFDRTQDDMYEAKHQCALNNKVRFITDCSLYINYVNEIYTTDYMKLFKNDLPFPYPVVTRNGDDNIIRLFHKSIWEANREHKKSPIEAWQDKELVKQAALNRLNYVQHCNPFDIINAFTVAKIAPKVSVFSVQRALDILKKYAAEYNSIVDPFSGFSARMIASARLNKRYTGFDLNEKHVQESNEIIKYLKLDSVSVSQQDILKKEDITIDECLFTCSPYGAKEQWNENEITKSCDEWIDICLEKYRCKRYIFVVDETAKYKDKVVETLQNRSHFGTNNEYVIVI